MKSVRVGRHAIRFFDEGSGRPLVLLPGFHAPSNAAAIEGMVGWREHHPQSGLGPTTVPRLAYFGTGEVFADALRSELDANQVEYVEAGWSGHAETMADASGVAEIVLPFLERHGA